MPRLVAPGWPALARQMGVWRGTFRRHDAAGCLLDSLASTVVRGLETTGEPRDGRLPVQSGRLSGWAMDVPDAPGTTVLVMERRDGSNLQVREISQPLEGGRRRVRGDPAIQGEGLVGRAHLEERQSSADWRAWGPAPMESDG